MLNLSIMPLDADHVEEICEDIVNQQKTGATSHAMFMMKFNPECTPVVDKAANQCKKYDAFRHRLDSLGAKHGVLVQATFGHIVVPSSPYPFQPTVSIVDGKEHVVTACPLDPGFREYLKGQMKTLAEHSPSLVMLDDDVGLLYRLTKGCACPRHMAEFNRRAKTNLTREQLYAATQGKSDEDKLLTSIYVDLIKDSTVGAVKAMREGLDLVNPKIQGIVSGIYTSTFCEFTADVAAAFAGEGNPRIVRLNGGPYAKPGIKYFTAPIYRAAILRENVKSSVDIFLAETDTCPQNRYSTSAAHLHAHFTASILEGARGAKHWITRLVTYEPKSGRAYRAKLAKYSKFYKALADNVSTLSPFGCRIPLATSQNYGFVESEQSSNLCPWASCVLERFGIPLYYSNNAGGAVFLDEFAVDGFSDAEIRKFLTGTLVLTALAAKKLVERGFAEYIGVKIDEFSGVVISAETVDGSRMSPQYEKKRLIPISDKLEVLSCYVHTDAQTGANTVIAPAVTRLDNSLGGETVVFSGSVDMPFKYYTAFSMLNETRKNQFISILSRRNHIPVYYPDDAEVYTRAAFTASGELFVALFNLSFDELPEIPLICKQKVTCVEMLNENGERDSLDFEYSGELLSIKTELAPISPIVLFIKTI